MIVVYSQDLNSSLLGDVTLPIVGRNMQVKQMLAKTYVTELFEDVLCHKFNVISRPMEDRD